MNNKITQKPIHVLALDLEATLISDVFSQIPRPGLRAFLEFCQIRFSRIVMFTGASEEWFKEVSNNLINSGDAPAWFASLEYISWDLEIKNLNFIPNASPENIILIDDYPPYIHPEQINNWIQIQP
jgi:NLI interacting factor-like phosphatase